MDKPVTHPLSHTHRVFFIALMVVCVVTLTLGLNAYRQAVAATAKAIACPLVHVPGVPLNLDNPSTPNAVPWRARTLRTIRILLGMTVLGVVILLLGFRYVWTLGTDRAMIVLCIGMLTLCALSVVIWRATPLPSTISCMVIDIN